MKLFTFYLVILIGLSCQRQQKNSSVETKVVPVFIIADTIKQLHIKPDSVPSKKAKLWVEDLPKKEVTPYELVGFAKTLVGIPYKFASTDPSNGFDCSGFITFVFNRFDIEVPRSSVGFTNIGKEIELQNAREGDLILFTGTVDSIRIVGHMGIVTENTDTLKFIHSTSGRAYAVTVSNFTNHYKKRFIKVARVFSN
jgi:hypothetical protein